MISLIDMQSSSARKRAASSYWMHKREAVAVQCRQYPSRNKTIRLVQVRRKKSEKKSRLSAEDWLMAARDALITEGKDAVKVERLAKKLNVTRGGFYWHFRDRDDLLDALLKSWEQETNVLFEQALQGDHADGIGELCALCRSWLEEDVYSPAYDSAVRDWARVSKRTAKAVKRVDRKRIDIIKCIFIDMGYSDDEAFIRARITYFHQVGYYALGLGETKPQRRKLAPRYVEALTGKKVTYEDVFPERSVP
jgi:AcrR family transcriptional regulator